MKRALLLAAATVISSGCYSRNNTSNINFYWRFQDAKGLIAGDWTDLNPGCVDATVTTVRILIDNQSFDADCVGPNSVPGVQIQTFAPGSYPYTILGFRNSEEIFADGGTVTVVGGSDASVFATLTVESGLTATTLPVYYSQNGALTCGGTTVTPFVAFELQDLSGQIVDEADNTAGFPFLGCDPVNLGFMVVTSFPGNVLPFGSYRFRYLSLLNQSQQAAYQVCCVAFDHEGFGQIFDLPPATAACPAVCP